MQGQLPPRSWQLLGSTHAVRVAVAVGAPPALNCLVPVLQLASRTSLNLAKRDINEFTSLISSVEVRLRGSCSLRQQTATPPPPAHTH